MSAQHITLLSQSRACEQQPDPQQEHGAAPPPRLGRWIWGSSTPLAFLASKLWWGSKRSSGATIYRLQGGWLIACKIKHCSPVAHSAVHCPLRKGFCGSISGALCSERWDNEQWNKKDTHHNKWTRMAAYRSKVTLSFLLPHSWHLAPSLAPSTARMIACAPCCIGLTWLHHPTTLPPPERGVFEDQVVRSDVNAGLTSSETKRSSTAMNKQGWRRLENRRLVRYEVNAKVMSSEIKAALREWPCSEACCLSWASPCRLPYPQRCKGNKAKVVWE